MISKRVQNLKIIFLLVLTAPGTAPGTASSLSASLSGTSPLSATIHRGLQLQAGTTGANTITAAVIGRGQRTQTAVLLLIVRFGCRLCRFRNGHPRVRLSKGLKMRHPCTFCHLEFIVLYLKERKYILNHKNKNAKKCKKMQKNTKKCKKMQKNAKKCKKMQKHKHDHAISKTSTIIHSNPFKSWSTELNSIIA